MGFTPAPPAGVAHSAQSLPLLLFGLPAGTWIERLPRRPVLIVLAAPAFREDLERAARGLSLL